MLQVLGTILVYYVVALGAIALTVYLVRVGLQFIRENRKQKEE